MANSRPQAYTNTKLLYLHGFRSSPRSHKAQVTLRRMTELGMADRLILPNLAVSPREAARQIMHCAEAALAETSAVNLGACDEWNSERQAPRLAIIGSSLGGYYASWLAEQLGPEVRAVLLNPAIRPDVDLARYLGVQTVYHSDETIEVRPEHQAELQALRVAQPSHRSRYWLIAATGDEVIDWHTMVAHYNGCRMHLEFGDEHALLAYDRLIDEVLAFCGLTGEG